MASTVNNNCPGHSLKGKKVLVIFVTCNFCWELAVMLCWSKWKVSFKMKRPLVDISESGIAVYFMGTWLPGVLLCPWCRVENRSTFSKLLQCLWLVLWWQMIFMQWHPTGVQQQNRSAATVFYGYLLMESSGSKPQLWNFCSFVISMVDIKYF